MEMLENIKYQSKMLTNLINDLLDLAKMESLNFKFNDDFFDLRELLKKASQTVHFMAKQKEINFVHQYDALITNLKSEFYKKSF